MSYNGRESGSINGRQPPLGQYVEDADYVVYKENGTIKAKRGEDGSVAFSGSDPASVINDCISALSSGGSIYIKQGQYNILSTIEYTNDNVTIIVGSGATVKMDADGSFKELTGDQDVTRRPAFYALSQANIQLINRGVIDANNTNISNALASFMDSVSKGVFYNTGEVVDVSDGLWFVDCEQTLVEGWLSTDLEHALVVDEGGRKNRYMNLYAEGAGTKTETMDFNGHNQYCWAVNIFGKDLSDQVVDVDECSNLLLANIFHWSETNEPDNILHFSSGGTGARYTDKTSPTDSNGHTVVNVYGVSSGVALLYDQVDDTSTFQNNTFVNLHLESTGDRTIRIVNGASNGIQDIFLEGIIKNSSGTDAIMIDGAPASNVYVDLLIKGAGRYGFLTIDINNLQGKILQQGAYHGVGILADGDNTIQGQQLRVLAEGTNGQGLRLETRDTATLRRCSYFVTLVNNNNGIYTDTDAGTTMKDITIQGVSLGNTDYDVSLAAQCEGIDLQNLQYETGNALAYQGYDSAPTAGLGRVVVASPNWDPDGDGNGELVMYDGSAWQEVADLPNYT